MHTGIAGSVFTSYSGIPDHRVSSTIRQTSFAGIISECSEMQKIFSIVEKVAATGTTVLVQGESGTGKELIARAIHRLSGRTGRLVPVNCAAIPEDLLESELFGHEKGSFTGATQARIGRFQIADGGTVFLDEVGEMSPKLQVKLLRVLQDHKVEPVGSSRSIEVDVRVIAATNKDLREEVKAGRFREDLFYRLQVLPINLPPLRTRANDVIVLARHFLEKSCEQLGKEAIRLSPETEAVFRNYAWSGNVRELENLMERLSILAEGECLKLSDLPDYMRGNGAETRIFDSACQIPDEGLDFNLLVEQFENKLISMALNRTSGNKKAAARLLGLNRTTLVEKIKKKGLEQQIEVLVETDSCLQV